MWLRSLPRIQFKRQKAISFSESIIASQEKLIDYLISLRWFHFISINCTVVFWKKNVQHNAYCNVII